MIASMSRTRLFTSLTWITILVVGLALFPAGRADGQATLKLGANLPMEGASNNSGKKQLATGQPAAAQGPPLAPPACPTFKLTAPKIPATSMGHHSVTLSWEASATNVDQTKNAVGYCVYRRETPGIPGINIKKRISECLNCQLVTETAIPGMGCVDDRVEDNKKYDYVVTYYVKPQGANDGAISDVSNEAMADTSKPGPAAPSYPSCH